MVCKRSRKKAKEAVCRLWLKRQHGIVEDEDEEVSSCGK